MFSKKTGEFLFLPALVTILFSCSFQYGNDEEAENTQPDVIMEKVEYVRVQGGDPVVRFKAELAEQYEERQIMNLETLTFEQFDNNWDNINIRGNAGKAEVEMESWNINLTEGVFISVESEDITIQTPDLRWQDEDRQLFGSATGTVNILRSDGTSFSGVGFSADARYRTWIFDSGVSGTLVEKEAGEEEELFEEFEEQ